MKKILLALSLFATLAVAAPQAQAGQFARVYTRHGVVYAPKSQFYYSGYHRHYPRYYRSYGYRPYYRSYYRSYYSDYDYYPSYASYPYCDYDYGYYRPYYRHHYYHRPRVSVAFSF